MQWDDAKSYNYTKNHTVKDWGWEFIRRDIHYIAQWEKALAEFIKTPPHQVLMPYLLAAEVSQYSDCSGRLNGTLNLCDSTKIDSFVIPADRAMEWGLRYYQNPEARLLVSANSNVTKIWHRGDTTDQEVEDEVTVGVEDHSLVVVIDLKKPLASQIQVISKRASEKQKQLKKLAPDIVSTRAEKVSAQDCQLWTKYLRCIDAKRAKIKPAFAARIIFPNAVQTSAAKWNDTGKQIKQIAVNNYRQFMS